MFRRRRTSSVVADQDKMLTILESREVLCWFELAWEDKCWTTREVMRPALLLDLCFSHDSAQRSDLIVHLSKDGRTPKS